MLPKIIFSVVLLILSGVAAAFKIFPYAKSYYISGQVQEVVLNGNTFEYIIVEDKTGKIYDFEAKGKSWKVLKNENCAMLKMYPSLIPTEESRFDRVSLEKIVDCDNLNIVNSKKIKNTPVAIPSEEKVGDDPLETPKSNEEEIVDTPEEAIKVNDGTNLKNLKAASNN